MNRTIDAVGVLSKVLRMLCPPPGHGICFSSPTNASLLGWIFCIKDWTVAKGTMDDSSTMTFAPMNSACRSVQFRMRWIVYAGSSVTKVSLCAALPVGAHSRVVSNGMIISRIAVDLPLPGPP